MVSCTWSCRCTLYFILFYLAYIIGQFRPINERENIQDLVKKKKKKHLKNKMNTNKETKK